MAALDFMRFQIFDSESYVGIPVILGSRLENFQQRITAMAQKIRSW